MFIHMLLHTHAQAHTHTHTHRHTHYVLSLSVSRSHFSADYLSVELEEIQSDQVIVYSQRKGTEMLTVSHGPTDR